MQKVVIQLEVDERGAIRGVTNTDQAFDRFRRKSEQTFDGMTKQARQSRDAMNLLSFTTGVQLPRELDRFLAKSKFVAPALAAAFNATLVLGFGAAVIALAPKIVETVNKLRDWHGIQKAQVAAQKELQEHYRKTRETVSQLVTELQKAGLSAEGQAFVDTQTAALAQRRAEDRLRLLRDEIRRQEAIAGSTTLVVGRGGLTSQEPTRAARDAQRELIDLRKDLRIAEDELMKAQLRSATVAKEFNSAAREGTGDTERHAAAVSQLTGELAHYDEVARSVSDAQRELNALARAEVDHLDEVARSQEAARKELEELERAHAEAAEASRRAAEEMAEAWERSRDSIVDVLHDLDMSGLDFFKRRWKQMLFQMIADAVMASGTLRNIFGSIFGVPLGGGQGAGSRGQGGIFGGGGGFGIPGLGGTPPFNPNPFAFGFNAVPFSAGGSGGASPLPAGASLGNLSLLDRLSGGGSLSRNQATFVALAGLGGMLLSGSGNRFVRATGRGLTGAALGAQIGSVIPGIGTLIGGLIGGIVGFVSGLFNRNGGKRDRLVRELQRQVDLVVKAYEFQQIDYNSAIAQLEQMRMEAEQQLRQLGGDGHRARDIVNAAIRAIQRHQQERQRRLAILFGGSMFGGLDLSGGMAMGNVIPFPTSPPGRTPAGGVGRGGGGGVDDGARDPILGLMQHRAARAPQAAATAAAPAAIIIQAWDGASVEAWLRNGGAEKIGEAQRRGRREGWDAA